MFTSGSNDTMDPDTTSAGVASVTIDSKFWLNKVKVQSTENAGLLFAIHITLFVNLKFDRRQRRRRRVLRNVLD